jgi:8-oxo-dGTP diphosphatase
MEKEKKVGGGVGIMIMKEGKILLGKRHDDPEKASSALRGEGTWTMPGGKLDFGESFEDGIRREVMEETGIKLNEIKVICVNNNKNEHAHFITIGLYCDDFEGEPQILEPDEIVEWQWFSLDNLPSPMYFPSAKIIENYKKGEFYIPYH